MRRHIMITAAVLLLTGCSTGGDGQPADETRASAEASPSETAVPKLSKEWGPKLDAAGDGAENGVCTEVGSPGCVKHITALTEVVYDAETAIEDADAVVLYPRSMKHIEGVEAASKAYVAAECKGSTDTALGDSVCAGYTATLLLGPASLSMTMVTDELSR